MLGDVVIRGLRVLVAVLAALGGLAFALADANSSVTFQTVETRGRYSSPTQATIEPQQAMVRPSGSIEPFGLDTAPVTTGELLANWSGVQAAIRDEREILERCREIENLCPVAAKKFLAIIAIGRAREGRARVGVINSAINLAIRPMHDTRWNAPLATLTAETGDCKDYAILKYVALREAGVAADDVRLVILRNLAVGEDHAVVAVRLDGTWTILDNRWQALVEDTQMRRMIPLFILDQEGVKQFAMQIARHEPTPTK
jgi:predicted transglutaminase-like cysteine proteinase